MGRIDEALRRSNLDAGRDIGAPPPAPSPWLFEHHEGRDAAGPVPSSVRGRGAEVRTDRPAPAEDGKPTRWGGFDAVAAERLVVSTTAPPLLVEQFRSLAATLLQAQHERSLKSVIVTSASPGDGKSYVALNLALTLSDSYQRRVLLIDADLRRPTLHKVFGVRNMRGLGDALATKTNGNVAAVEITQSLALLPAGRPEPNPLGGLSSHRMTQIVADAASRFDWVMVDSPPVGVLADGRLVFETVDAAILVVRAGVTRFPDLQAAADMMGRERILGIVLNAVDPGEIRGEGYYRHYYGERP